MDLNLDINGDLIVTQNGDFATVDGADEIQQALMRGLFTCPAETLADGTQVFPDYIFTPSFGIGIPRIVGQPLTASFKTAIQQRIRNAVFSTEGIDLTQDPKIEYFQANRAVYAQITYFLLGNIKNQQTLVFPVQ